jgi:hypothetical protein
MTRSRRVSVSGESGVEFRSSAAATHFAEEIVRMQGGLRYPGLREALKGEPLCCLERYGDGLMTLSFRQQQMPTRYLRAVFGFRLAQFLQAGLIDPEIVYRQSMFHESVEAGPGPDTIHTVSLTQTGQIVGYIALTGSPDRHPLPLDATDRCRFPAEAAHGVDLLSRYAAATRTTHSVREIKRFVRNHALPKGAQRERVPWHLVLAIMKVGASLGDEIQVVLGDASEAGALRHLRVMGLDLVVIDGTTPWLPRTELMWPSYLAPPERRAKPFVALVPSRLGEYAAALDGALAMDHDDEWQRNAILRVLELSNDNERLGVM